MKLFQYALIFKEVDKDNKFTGKGKIIQEITSILAIDQQAASFQAATNVPVEYKDKLDQVELVIRPF